MSYSIDLKKRVVDYRLGNHTIKETSEAFQIGTTTVKSWVKEFISTGELRSENNSSKRTFKKINPAKLKNYINQHNDLFLKEIAAQFSCSINTCCESPEKAQNHT
jgi:transposase